MQLRLMLGEMGMSSFPSLLPLPEVHELLDADGKPTSERLRNSIKRFLDEHEWYANSLKAGRAPGTPH